MLRSIESLHGCAVVARDGEMGTVSQAYFDDEAWGVRYLVVDTGNWISKRQVLISPYSIRHSDPGSDTVQVDLTRQQVRDSPDIDTRKPVSRQYETSHLLYYGYPRYWGGANLWGLDAYPAFPGSTEAPRFDPEAPVNPEPHADEPAADIHLRSTNAVKGCHIKAVDGSIGHVSGFVFDDVAWVIRYLSVDTRNWWPGGKEVLLATQWISQTNWFDSTVSTELSREAIRNSPAYDDTVPLSRNYEQSLHGFYGKEAYWSKDDTESLLAHIGDTAS
ncbi:PRC-barrel domain-containing protein [Paraburkholderia phenazinium]|jgi:hypothetical protein|uniref:PRC-barrel domain-containing protein n=1 Tax=Paraburkholderia phenazinium TaxID=60549 RepID=UPI00158BF5ED|nr:PRC-barrel domain-containing protein [Paraburkholderia phenazinium]